MTELERAAVDLAKAICKRRSSEDMVVSALENPNRVLTALTDLRRARSEEQAAENRYWDAVGKEGLK